MPVACVAVLVALSLTQPTFSAETEDEAYSLLPPNAAKMTQEMEFADKEQRVRVQDIIANQYRTLRDIHAKRDADGSSESVVAAARLAMFEAQNPFSAQLRAELACDQVEQVKDGLTDGVFNHTDNEYPAKVA